MPWGKQRKLFEPVSSIQPPFKKFFGILDTWKLIKNPLQITSHIIVPEKKLSSTQFHFLLGGSNNLENGMYVWKVLLLNTSGRKQYEHDTFVKVSSTFFLILPFHTKLMNQCQKIKKN